MKRTISSFLLLVSIHPMLFAQVDAVDNAWMIGLIDVEPLFPRTEYNEQNIALSGKCSNDTLTNICTCNNGLLILDWKGRRYFFRKLYDDDDFYILTSNINDSSGVDVFSYFVFIRRLEKLKPIGVTWFQSSHSKLIKSLRNANIDPQKVTLLEQHSSVGSIIRSRRISPD